MVILFFIKKIIFLKLKNLKFKLIVFIFFAFYKEYFDARPDSDDDEVKKKISSFMLDDVNKKLMQLYLRSCFYIINKHSLNKVCGLFYQIYYHPQSNDFIKKRIGEQFGQKRVRVYFFWVKLVFVLSKLYGDSNFKEMLLSSPKYVNNFFSTNFFSIEFGRWVVAKSILKQIIYATHKKHLSFSMELFSHEVDAYRYILRELEKKRISKHDWIYFFVCHAFQFKCLRLFLLPLFEFFSDWDEIHITWTRHKLLLYRRNLHKIVFANTRVPGVSIKKKRQTLSEGEKLLWITHRGNICLRNQPKPKKPVKHRRPENSPIYKRNVKLNKERKNFRWWYRLEP